MDLMTSLAGAQQNPTTSTALSRATKILSNFANRNWDAKIVAEIYDAVLVAKAKGISETETFEKFAKKYNIGADLKSEIQAVMSKAS